MCPNQTAFPTTDWFALFEAVQSDLIKARVAMGKVLEIYLPPMRRYMRYRWSFSTDQIDELLQGFVTDRILKAKLFARARYSRGKFRNFLVRALDNYVIGQYRKNVAYTRRVSSTDPHVLGLVSQSKSVDPKYVFDRSLAEHVLERAVAELRAYCSKTGRPHIWDVFCLRLRTQPPQSYEFIVKQLGLASERKAAAALHAAKRIFIRIIRQIFIEYGATADTLADEIRDLRTIFGNHAA